jgi:hypothetical protein
MARGHAFTGLPPASRGRAKLDRMVQDDLSRVGRGFGQWFSAVFPCPIQDQGDDEVLLKHLIIPLFREVHERIEAF